MSILISRISTGLGIPASKVYVLYRTASHRYKRYLIGKKSGGKRVIHHPSRELKAVQRWLNYDIISQFLVHDSATAYRQKMGIAHNASRHVESKYLLKLDFENFFPSITSVDIKKFLKKNRANLPAGWMDIDDEIFCNLVCLYGALTIGAPTSPSLSNVVCYQLDTEITAMLTGMGVVYTRYADDMTFSTRVPNVLNSIPDFVSKICGSLSFPGKLKINARKTSNRSRKWKRTVTGVVLSSDGTISAGRELKRVVRHKIHRYATLDEDGRKWLAGIISHISSIESTYYDSLVAKYGESLVRHASNFVKPSMAKGGKEFPELPSD